ncbi:MAG: hypothetical protein NC548_29705 [Lachnospiraceae bacterium]|nr:hypothetical protein [Lachnospiraceae bacterium]
MSVFADKYIKEWASETVDLMSRRTLMRLNPVEACKRADCVEEYQWAVQNWFHSDVAVLEEIHTSMRRPYFTVVLENWGRVDDNDASFKITRIDLSESELVGMHQYYLMTHSNI